VPLKALAAYLSNGMQVGLSNTVCPFTTSLGEIFAVSKENSHWQDILQEQILSLELRKHPKMNADVSW